MNVLSTVLGEIDAKIFLMNKIEPLLIDFTSLLTYKDPMQKISFYLDQSERYLLGNIPWTSFPYKPKVQFSVLHNGECIFLKYYVEERVIRANANTINGKVWEDSCVEFFVGFDNNGYYNFEFNCIGTALGGFGKNGSDRQLLPEDVIQKIKCSSTIERKESIHWEITICIPAETFIFHKNLRMSGKECSANFYKCGDELPEPHFVTWSNIESAKPDFHLPQFFGNILFREVKFI